jgi:hypothetical protein
MEKKRKNENNNLEKNLNLDHCILIIAIGSDSGCEMNRYLISMKNLGEKELKYLSLCDKIHDEDLTDQDWEEKTEKLIAFHYIRYCLGIIDKTFIEDVFKDMIPIGCEKKWNTKEFKLESNLIPEDKFVHSSYIINYCIV